MNQEVTDFIEAIKEPWQRELSASLREVVLGAIPDVKERIQYNKPHFLKKMEIRSCDFDFERCGQLYDL